MFYRRSDDTQNYTHPDDHTRQTSDDHVGYGYFARQEKCETITKWDDAKNGPTQLYCYFYCPKHLTDGCVLLKFCYSYD